MRSLWAQFDTATKIRHIVLYLIGVGIMPLGVVLTINAHLGAGGYDALNFALAETLHINTSMAIYGTAVIILLIAALIRKGYPRIETFVSSFFLGLFTDFWKMVLQDVQGTGLVNSIVILLAGVVVVAFAVACYMISIFPTNPSDDLVVAMHERGMKIGAAKMGFDLFCVIAAFMLGGEIGIGTVICTFCMGPIIDLFHGHVETLFRLKQT